MTERFVGSTGTISIDTGDSTVVGTGTLFGGRDREAAQVWVQPADGAPYRVGTVAAVDPRGVYDHFELPLVHAWNGDPVVDQPYELIDGLALANGATQAAIYARYTAHLEQNMGLAGNLADEIDWSLVPQDSLFVDGVTRTIWQWRNGVLEPVYAVGAAFVPRGAWDDETTYDANDLVEIDGGVFVSNADGNLDHQPTIAPDYASDAYWTWIPIPQGKGLFDLAVQALGKPTAGELIGRFEFTRTTTFPAGLTLARFSAGAGATAESVITFKRNGTTFGAATFAAAADTAVLAAAAPTTFTPGDIFEAYAPAVADDTLADIAGTLCGSLSGGALEQTGIATLDFGAFPGASDASVVVTGQGRIAANSIVHASLWPGEGTDDHSADEHVMAGMKITISDVVAGVGFTIRAICTEPEGRDAQRHYGEWNVAWTWN